MFTIQNLTYAYHDSPPYHYNLSVNQGQIVAILGKSGSGKSTLLDLIAGFLTPHSGTIMIEGKAIENLPIEKRPITILFQKHNLFEHLSVEKNIALGNRDATPQAISAILKEVGLEGYEKRSALDLSGGQQQRVALARALIRQKPILLLDEPFTGLDSQTREQMLELVERLTVKHHLHTIMITHEKRDCDLASRTYTMRDYQLS